MITVVTVCGLGLGTALLLKMSAMEAFDDLGVGNKVEVKTSDISSALETPAEIYIVTMGLHERFEERGIKNLYKVKDIMDSDEIKKGVTPFVEELKKKGLL